MNAQELDDRLAAAIPIVRAAGALALDYFNDRGGLAIEHKGQQDLVSIADRAVEELIRGELATAFPGRRGAGRGRRRGRRCRADLGARPDRRHLQLPQGHPVLGRGRGLRRRRPDGDRPHLRPGPRRAVHRPARRRRLPQRRRRSGSRATPRVDTSCLALAYSFRQPQGDLRRHGRRGAAPRASSIAAAGSTAIQLCWVADGRCDALRHAALLVLGLPRRPDPGRGGRRPRHGFRRRPRPARQRRRRRLHAGPGAADRAAERPALSAAVDRCAATGAWSRATTVPAREQ